MCPSSRPLTIAIYDSLQAVDPAAWDALCMQMERPTYFHSAAWTEIWSRGLGASRRIKLLAVHRGEALVGLLPLGLHSQRRICFRRTLLTPLTGLSLAASQYLGPICAKDDEPEVLEALAVALRGLRGHHALYWENYLAGSITERLIERVERQGGGRFLRWSGETTHRTALPSSYDEFFSGLPKKMRQNLRTGRNKLAKLPGASLARAHDAAALNAALAAFRRHSVARLGEKGVESSLVDERMVDFFQRVVHRAAVDGRGATFTASLDGAIVGTLFALHFGRWLCYYNGSFDPAFGNLSVGTLLVDELVRYATENGFSELDLLAGSGEYKLRWAPGSSECLQYASLAVAPLISLPFTVWDAWKASGQAPLANSEAANEPATRAIAQHVLPRAMHTARSLWQRLPSRRS